MDNIGVTDSQLLMAMFTSNHCEYYYYSLFRRLLSSLHANESTSSSPDNEMTDAKEFGEQMKERGNDGKAWIMSHTIQKLQSAQQRGKVEVEWQQ